MNKNDLENKLKSEGLLSVFTNGLQKKYIDGETLLKNGIVLNAVNVFGIFKIFETNEYKIFITDDERGIPYYSARFGSEEEACNALYEKIARLKRIHDKGL